MINPMRDSGVEWIGNIPEGWEVTKIKYTTQLNGRIGWQGLTSSEYQEQGPYLITGTDFENGQINFEKAVHIEEQRWKEATQIQVENNDLLITKDGTVGKVAIISGLNEKASLNSGVLRIQTTEKVWRKFLYYVLLSEEFWLWFNYTNSGSSTILHLYQNVFERFTYVIPTIQEQQGIANFLDEETKKLDDAKELLEQQIDKLKEYRKSLIWETVTKGLDKTVPMKDSGVDWIGEIPEGWELTRLKYLAKITTGTADSQDKVNEGEFPFYIRSQKPVNIDYFTHDCTAILTAGDGDIGNIWHYVSGKFTAHQRVYIISDFIKLIDSRYLYFYFCEIFKLQPVLFDAKTTVGSLRMSMLSDFEVLLPEIKVQQAIANFLDEKRSIIEEVISNIKAQIEIINKQKKTLIYDYVTGKRRVEL